MSDPSGSGRADGSRTTRRVAWDRVLVWFMRSVAAVWIAKGLAAWLVILGVRHEVLEPFAGMGLTAQAMVIIFAVLDPVAGVGLWLTSTWGGVMWLLAVMVHVVFAVFRPEEARISGMTMGLEMGLVLLYVALSWMASREET